MLSNSTLRHIWQIVEKAQARLLLEFTDSELVRWIQIQLESQIFVSDWEINAACNYIQTRIPLIRDLAESRLATA